MAGSHHVKHILIAHKNSRANLLDNALLCYMPSVSDIKCVYFYKVAANTSKDAVFGYQDIAHRDICTKKHLSQNTPVKNTTIKT